MKKIFAANWKLYKSPQQAREFLTHLKNQLDGNLQNNQRELIIFPSTICLESVSESLKGSQIKFGAQNCYAKAEGAFTGETSAAVVKELGGDYILLGHSERRSLFNESDDFISQKIQLVQSLGLIPVLCVGEHLDDREAGRTSKVVEDQLTAVLKLANNTIDSQKGIIIAYEPVWAIGTGKVATPQQVSETHKNIRSILDQLGFTTSPIIYGGSVKPENASELISQNNVDGFLIGGASLDVESFLKIANAK